MEFGNPHEAQRRGSTWVEDKLMARKSLSPLCRPPGLGCPQATQSPRRMLPLPPMWRWSPQMRRSSPQLSVILPPGHCHHREAPAPIPPDKQATEALPLYLRSHPTQFCHFSSQRRASRKEIRTWSDFKGSIETFPLKASLAAEVLLVWGCAYSDALQ